MRSESLPPPPPRPATFGFPRGSRALDPLNYYLEATSAPRLFAHPKSIVRCFLIQSSARPATERSPRATNPTFGAVNAPPHRLSRPSDSIRTQPKSLPGLSRPTHHRGRSQSRAPSFVALRETSRRKDGRRLKAIWERRVA